jgi:hypothetical protein
MNNPETGRHENGDNEFFRVRTEVISTEAANAAQLLLMKKMLPEILQGYVVESDGATQSISDEFFMHWHEKYSVLFREYCDKNMDDGAFVERIESQTLSAIEIEDVVDFITKEKTDKSGNKIGGKFLATMEEVQNFMTNVTH